MSDIDPAIKSYFFGKGYADLWDTITESWRRNIESASERIIKCGKSWPESWPNDEDERFIVFLKVFLFIFHLCAALAILIFGTIFFLLASTVHIALLFAFFTLIYIGFSLAFFVDWIYRTIRRFFAVCPVCHHKSPLPEYKCPSCPRWHGWLAPNKYGILHHTCRCGKKLPCVFFLGRSQLRSRCPVCKNSLDTVHTDSQKVFIPMMGGVAAGKTIYLAVAFDAYRQALRTAHGQAKFHDDSDTAEFQAILSRLGNGQLPDKTGALLPKARPLQIKQPYDKAGARTRLLYLYDPAGEAFHSADELASHHYLEYLSGVLLLVDPFAFDEFRLHFGIHEESDSGHASPGDILHRILQSMREQFGLPIEKKIPVPVAVVLTKMDKLPTAMQPYPKTILSWVAALGYVNAVTDYSNHARSLLEAAGLKWIVQSLEIHCAHVSYFGCSALGRAPDGTGASFRGWGCYEPIAWLLSREHKDYLPADKTKT